MAGAVKIISPDGKSEKLWPAEHVREMEAQGWKVAGGQKIGVQTEEGRLYLPAEDALQELGPDDRFGTLGAVPAELAEEDYQGLLREQKYGDRGGEAFLAGAARGLTFGLSDVVLPGLGLVDKETLAGLKEENVGYSLAGELGSIVGGGIAGAGKGIIGRVASKTPVGALSRATARYGERGTRQYLTGQAAEGMLQGIGMSVSEVALSDTPWASETAARELLMGGLTGGALGLGGAAAFKGGSALASKLRRPKAPDILDITTDSGQAYLGGLARNVQKNLDIGDDVFKRTDLEAARRITSEEVEGLQRYHGQIGDEMDDLIARMEAKRQPLASLQSEIPYKPVMPELELPARPNRGSFKKASDYDKALSKWESQTAKLEEGRASAFAKATEEYDQSVAKIASVSDANSRTIAKLDEQIAALKGHRKALGEAAWAKAGASIDDVAGDTTGLLSKGSQARFDIRASQKLLGEDGYYADQLKRIMDDAADVGKELNGRAAMQVPDGLAAARQSFQEADAAARKMFGSPTGASLGKIVSGTPEEVVDAFNVLQKRAVAAEELASISGDRALLKSVREQYGAISDELMQAIPQETVEAMSKMDIGLTLAAAGLPTLTEGPYGDAAGLAAVFALLRKGKGISNIAKAVRGGGKVSSSLGGQMAQAGAGAAAYSAAPGQGLVGRAVKGAAARGAYKILGRGMDAVATPGGMFRLAGKAQSEMRQALGLMGRKVAKGSLQGGGGAATILRGLKLGEDYEKEQAKEDSLQALFKKRSQQLRELAHDRQALRQAIWDDTKELRDANPYFGDKAEVAISRAIEYMHQTMPRDPGGHEMLGGSAWQPDEFAIQQWVNRVQGVLDPFGVVRGVKDGSITAEGAEALRTVHPETFAAIQMGIASNIEEIKKNLSYDEENRLSILMGVPVNAVTQPDYIQFIAQTYAQRAQKQSQSMGSVDTDALLQGRPTRAQQLLNRDR